MFAFLRRLLSATRTSATTRARRSGFRPGLEALEDRQLLSVAPSALDANSALVVTDNNNLYYYHHNGDGTDTWNQIDHDVAQVSAGRDGVSDTNSGDVAFVLNTDGSLWDRHGVDGTGTWYKLAANSVSQVSASQVTPDMAYVLFNDGTLYSHVGTDADSGWTQIDGNVAKVQATQQSQGVNGAVILYKDGSVKEYAELNDGKHFWTLAPGQVQDISAAPLATFGQAYFLYQDGTLSHHAGFEAPYDSLTQIATGVTQMSASDRVSIGNVFALDDSGHLTEYWQKTDGLHEQALASNVSSIAAVMPQGTKPDDSAYTLDNVYVQFNDGSLGECADGWAGNPTWHFATPPDSQGDQGDQTAGKPVQVVEVTPPAATPPQAPAAAAPAATTNQTASQGLTGGAHHHGHHSAPKHHAPKHHGHRH